MTGCLPIQFGQRRCKRRVLVEEFMFGGEGERDLKLLKEFGPATFPFGFLLQSGNKQASQDADAGP
jgi:hypothetical protein